MESTYISDNYTYVILQFTMQHANFWFLQVILSITEHKIIFRLRKESYLLRKCSKMFSRVVEHKRNIFA